GVVRTYHKSTRADFLDPEPDPQGVGWNIFQSLVAIAGGQATGEGFSAGTRAPLGYVPIAESDLVFAGLAEDLGFAGAVILFALYIVLLVAALRVAFRARDPFGLLIGGGVARSEEHTSELQSLRHLVCRLLLEKKKKKNT